MAALVVSVEYIELTMADTVTSDSDTLSLGQDIDQCVIRMASINANVNGDGPRSAMPDMWFTGTDTINCARESTNASGAMTVGAFVIEYASTVQVQQKTFSMADGVSSTTVAITDVTAITQAFAYIYNLGSDSGEDYEHSACRVSFNSTTQAQVDRGDDTGAVSGHLFFVDHTNFTTEHILAVWSGTTNTDTLSGAVTPTEAFLAISVGSTLASEAAEAIGVRSRLGGATGTDWDEVYHERDTSSSNVQTQTTVVECDDSDFDVQRGAITVGTNPTGTDTITAIDQTCTHAQLSSPYFPKMDSDGVGDCQKCTAYIEFTSNTVVQVTANSGAGEDNNDVWYEVVQWVKGLNGSTGAAGMLGCNT
jgi:hypothetical protein